MESEGLASVVLRIVADNPGITADDAAELANAQPVEIRALIASALAPRVTVDALGCLFITDERAFAVLPAAETVFPTQANLSSFLNEFLAKRDLRSADGRPVYAYRCSVPELEDLQRILKSTASLDFTRGQSGRLAAGFVLYAAEWWRRFHTGGSWKWEPILESIGVRLSNIAEVYPAVDRGLRFWNRRLLTNAHGRMFLVTLACEGGLPLQLLRNSSGRLRLFFRRLMEDYGLYFRTGVTAADLAQRDADELPRSWRQEVVFELSGLIVEKVWELQERVRGSKDPVGELDRVEPDWRAGMPLDLGDDVARALLNNLVVAAGQIREGGSADLRLIRQLRSSATGWELRAEFSFPPTMTLAEFAGRLNVDAAKLPSRGDLLLVNTSGAARRAAAVTQFGRGDENSCRIERLSASVMTGPEAAESWSVRFESLSIHGDAVSIRGGENLSEDLPWIFGEQDEGLFRYVGQGSVRTRFPRCLVALPAGIPVPPDSSSINDPGLQRTYVDISSFFEVADAEGSRFLIRPAEERDDAIEVVIEGDYFTQVADDRVVFLGPPVLRYRDQDGRTRTLPQQTIQWRPTGPGTWRPWSNECLGRISIRVVEGEETRFQAVREVLPSDFELKLLPQSLRQGVLEFRTGQRALVSCDVVEGCDASIDIKNDVTTIRLSMEGRAPSAVDVTLDFGAGRQVTLPLPFPIRGARFVGPHETVVRHEQTVRPDQLIDYRLEAFGNSDADRFRLGGALDARDLPMSVPATFSTEVPRRSGGRHAAELRSMTTPIHDLFAQSLDIDATVFLKADGPSVGPVKLLVKRYDREFAANETSVGVRDFSGNSVAPTALTVEMLRLWDPAAGREPLVFDSESDRWTLLGQTWDAGPWLLVGSESGRPSVRPKLLYFKGSVEDRSALQSAICLERRAEVDAAIRAVLSELVNRTMDDDWAIVRESLALTREVPPATVAVVSALAENQAAAVTALMLALDDPQVVAEALCALPFEWYLVGVGVWKDCLVRVSKEIRALSPEAAIAFAHAFFSCFEACPELRLLLPLADHLRGDSATLTGRPSATIVDSTFAEFEQARQIVLLKHEEFWPAFSPVHSYVSTMRSAVSRRLAQRFAGVLTAKQDVLLAPIVSVDVAVSGSPCPPDLLLAIRAARRFDMDWFDVAYRAALRLHLQAQV